MQCPKCRVEMRATTCYRVTGDQSPNTETRLAVVQRFYCRSEGCPNCGQLVQTVENPLTLEAP